MLEKFTKEMTVDEAIKDLEKIKKIKFTPTNVPVSIDMAIDALKGVRDDDNEDALLKLIGSNEHLKPEKVISSIKIEALKATRWIPVSEQLPDPGVNVLVCTKQKTGTIYERIGIYTGTAYGWSTGGASKNVVAWMPLPEPYKE